MTSTTPRPGQGHTLVDKLREHERDYPTLIHGPLCGEAATALTDSLTAMESFLAPYAELSEADLKWISELHEEAGVQSPGADTTITPHIAQSILTMRGIVAKAKGN